MLSLPPLYAITDASQPGTLADQCRVLGEAGFPLVQFRGKGLDPAEQWRQLRQALTEAAEGGGWPLIVVNDRADLAVLAAQEGLTPWGLHLGQDDLPPSEARKLPGLAEVHIGTSTHDVAEWTDVDPACDHAGLGPFRATASKGDHAQPIGPEGLRTGCGLLRSRGLAPVAIGGLTMADAEGAFEAGAESLAMIGSIARAAHPEALLWEAQLLRWKARPLFRAGQSIVVAGGSGAGKSTLAVELARQLGVPSVDLDAHIEAQAGCSVSELFVREGEAGFRAREVAAIQDVLAVPSVVALGGGAWELPEVRQAVATAGAAPLWLAEVPARAWARVGQDPARPLAGDRAVFMARWRRRMAAWSGLPMVLPLGHDAPELAQAMILHGMH